LDGPSERAEILDADRDAVSPVELAEAYAGRLIGADQVLPILQPVKALPELYERHF
jgi:hypothetical protein